MAKQPRRNGQSGPGDLFGRGEYVYHSRIGGRKTKFQARCKFCSWRGRWIDNRAKARESSKRHIRTKHPKGGE